MNGGTAQRARVLQAAEEAIKADPFGAALKALDAWNKEAAAAHAEHMAAIADLRSAFNQAMAALGTPHA